jgi:hypothetical protein
MLAPDPHAPIWCLWWLNPSVSLTWDRPGIASSTYLCGFLARRDAVEHAAREGWEVVG